VEPNGTSSQARGHRFRWFRYSRYSDRRDLNYFNFAYSALAWIRIGMSGSAFFHNAKKS
jgi:hypothetical protein